MVGKHGMILRLVTSDTHAIRRVLLITEIL